jgi:HTH-type transcriptional regulator/antitoxin HigA
MAASSWILGALFSLLRPGTAGTSSRQADSIETRRDGFSYQQRRGSLIEISWPEIERAVSYRVELYTGELECLDIHFCDGRKTLSLNEEMPGFFSLTEQMTTHVTMERVASAWETASSGATAQGSSARRLPLRAGLLAKAAPLWPPLADVLRVPRTESEYRELSELLHSLNDEIRDQEGHSLSSLRDVVALLVDAYLQAHPPCPG